MVEAIIFNKNCPKCGSLMAETNSFCSLKCSLDENEVKNDRRNN